MTSARPFASDESLYLTAEAIWRSLGEADFLEAFGGHPQIGATVEELASKFATTAGWSSSEQGAVKGADLKTLEALRDGNVEYKERFGFIFIVCATGKGASEIAALLQSRLDNGRAQELAIAAAEQGKITRLRLEKLSA
jgi:2-oxo-4-hydroxy-4-carboxy-5-ureidoimidazoline decarboxylase